LTRRLELIWATHLGVDGWLRLLADRRRRNGGARRRRAAASLEKLRIEFPAMKLNIINMKTKLRR
jgi:hypothetical protein